ncbi:MAG: ABC transporter substrate-binding protein [Armatimonadota bacterium]|nr:ABC transporter substrate-binding protein [Armatimonadota bacterium]MDR7463846.1 ABC transporter substrate-binding protein [Armatimonadota bacterium]MDR7470134.1 ABC transporter substrate-binding protein [Armatimonadota bacterium]MDR7474984.1 ABC transporter substrate-binding protein [Armatimonadota bacterium]MDR7537958.1 ABC transporter substrate-binding protein [Armatimonadota bacterium]
MLVVILLVAAGCRGEQAVGMDRVRLQLRGAPQAQFAGYYAAKEKGFYREEQLDVVLMAGGPDAAPEGVVAAAGAEFGLGWLPDLLVARERGAPLANIAQIFQYSGMRELARRDSGIATAADLRGRRVAVWVDGSEYPLLATLAKHGIDPRRDLTLVPQPADMRLFIERRVDAAAAMTYRGYKEVLDAGIRPEGLLVIDFNREGTALLEDGLFVLEPWLRQGANREIAVRFLRASLRGWQYCRDNAPECVDIILRHSPALNREEQIWMMAEVNKLIWGPPAPSVPLGRMQPEAFQRTARILQRFGALQKPADLAAYTSAIWEKATSR